MRLNILARKSDLARLQAYQVGAALKNEHPHLNIQYEFRASLGDQNQHDPLWKMPEKGVFTEDFLQDLIDERADLVVHSWKDLPTESRPHTEIAATLPRADMRDVLLVRESDLEKSKIRILTSSPRREYALRSFLKWAWPKKDVQFEFVPVRGNIPTRLKKLMTGEGEAWVVAKAALDRLLDADREEFLETKNYIRECLASLKPMVLPLQSVPCAAAQGALAIEIKRDRPLIAELVRAVNCASTFRTVQFERETLRGYGGGCHQKIGITCLARPYGDVQIIKGESEKFGVLDHFQLYRDLKPWPEAKADEIFENQQSWFERSPVDMTILQSQLDSAEGLWVAKAEAWPQGFHPKKEQWIWVAGLKTWEKLAAQGIWVNGSSESLGEQELPRLEQVSGKNIIWTKLTHEQAALDSGIKIGTYRLKPVVQIPDLSTKRFFFWSSGSHFDRAFQEAPEVLREAYHGCGPGWTYQAIIKQLGSTGKVRVFLNYEDWKAHLASRPKV